MNSEEEALRGYKLRSDSTQKGVYIAKDAARKKGTFARKGGRHEKSKLATEWGRKREYSNNGNKTIKPTCTWYISAAPHSARASASTAAARNFKQAPRFHI